MVHAQRLRDCGWNDRIARIVRTGSFTGKRSRSGIIEPSANSRTRAKVIISSPGQGRRPEQLATGQENKNPQRGTKETIEVRRESERPDKLHYGP